MVIIEPNPAIAEMISWMLQFAGYRTIYLDPLIALIRFAHMTPADQPRLILLDLSTPCINVEMTLSPLEMCWTTREVSPPSIIVLTTNPLIQRAVVLAGYQALLKPFHTTDLLAAVRLGLSSLQTSDQG
jgi:DNA-binding response OmpR family regulator